MDGKDERLISAPLPAKAAIFLFAFPAPHEQYIAVIFLRNYFIDATGGVDVISVVHEVNRTIRESKVSEGLITVAIPAPGAGLVVVEPLPDIVARLKETSSFFPGGGSETKNRRKEDVAVGPRIASAMLGRALSLPVDGGRLVLAPREEIVLVDFEPSPRRREFFVQVMGGDSAAQKGAPPRRR
ncbi:MAG TPA: YjbQ family protein [bacterium]|nr:YjbQ family protein [bacterium]